MKSNAHKFRMEMLQLYLTGLLNKDTKYKIEDRVSPFSKCTVTKLEATLNGIYSYVYEVNHSDESFLSTDFDDVILNGIVKYGITTTKMVSYANLTVQIMKELSKSYRHTRKLQYGGISILYASSLTLRCDYIRGVVIIETHPAIKNSEFRMKTTEVYRTTYDDILKNKSTEVDKISKILQDSMKLQKTLENKFSEVKKTFAVEATKEWSDCITQMKS